MTKINFSFNYEAPDFKGSPTRNLQKTGEWVYEGPENFYVAITPQGILSRKPAVPSLENKGYLFGDYYLTVEVNARKNPIVAAIVFENLDLQTFHQSSWIGPDRKTYVIDDPVLLTDAYDRDTISYDSNTDQFSCNFVDFGTTWDNIREQRNGLLEYYDGKIRDDMLETLYNEYLRIRQELRDITTTWEGYEPVQVILPEFDPTPSSTS